MHLRDTSYSVVAQSPLKHRVRSPKPQDANEQKIYKLSVL